MPDTKRRQSFEQGHQRKLLVVVDETPEVENALFFAAHRIRRTGGKLVLLYVIEPQDFQHWMGVKDVQRQEGVNKAAAIFRLFRRKMTLAGFDEAVIEEVIREGSKPEQIVDLIQGDEDIGILVLGASTDARGPGPLVSAFVAGRYAGTFPIPITIVPGGLKPEDIATLA
jgi:nucleotide-binding universal stress UspA family protein